MFHSSSLHWWLLCFMFILRSNWNETQWTQSVLSGDRVHLMETLPCFPRPWRDATGHGPRMLCTRRAWIPLPFFHIGSAYLHPPDPSWFIPAPLSTVIHRHHSWHTWCFSSLLLGPSVLWRGLPKPKCLLKTHHFSNPPYSQLPFSSFSTSPDMLAKQTKPESYLKKDHRWVSEETGGCSLPPVSKRTGQKGGANKTCGKPSTILSRLRCLVEVYDAGFLVQKLKIWLSEE